MSNIELLLEALSDKTAVALVENGLVVVHCKPIYVDDGKDVFVGICDDGGELNHAEVPNE